MSVSLIRKVPSLQLEREAFDGPRDCEKGVDVFASRKVDCVHQLSLCGAKRLERPTLTFTLCQAKSDGWRPAFLCGAFMIQCDQSRVFSFQSHAEYTTVQDVYPGVYRTCPCISEPSAEWTSHKSTNNPCWGKVSECFAKSTIFTMTTMWNGESNSELER